MQAVCEQAKQMKVLNDLGLVLERIFKSIWTNEDSQYGVPKAVNAEVEPAVEDKWTSYLNVYGEGVEKVDPEMDDERSLPEGSIHEIQSGLRLSQSLLGDLGVVQQALIIHGETRELDESNWPNESGPAFS